MIRAKRHRTADAMCVAQAAPAGGARRWWGRGCGFALGVLVSFASGAEAQTLLPVPSGQPVHLSDVLLDENPGELWVRFRFVAPKIGPANGQIGHDVASIDMDHLCQTLAVPYVSEHRLEPARVVISLSDRELEFGHAAPEATQYFEAYRLEGARCIWEGL
ncbi:hypothetical protein AVO45_10685 [Ruegeria marisrubri]|uniref:Acetolactate synthase n=1 Tax=Ruegeria marisrubri TaxID=1685379 RepID=A0A0X3TME9_9RHOB|nr:DUF6497 family protein [Ruegeria marisrubri]KUJ76945.1 hypothetical protein AVO45_10685 [Ruegeria marisrubri]